LILVGIGVSAMLESFIAYILSNAPAWSLQEAMRWLTGSVNGARLDEMLPLLIALIVFGGLLLSRSRDLEALRLGDDSAAALGTHVGRTRIVIMISRGRHDRLRHCRFRPHCFRRLPVRSDRSAHHRQ
jgi:iron complex transport system permease protein